MALTLDSALWPCILHAQPQAPGRHVVPATSVSKGVPLKIRSIHDSPELLASVLLMGEAMHKESSVYRDISYDQRALMKLYYNICKNPTTMACFVACKNAEIMGMIGGYITPFFFSTQQVAMDMFLFVNKQQRGSTVAPRLVKKFEQWARKNGASRVVLGVSTGVDTERTLQMYRHFGYEDIGAIVKKDL